MRPAAIDELNLCRAFAERLGDLSRAAERSSRDTAERLADAHALTTATLDSLDRHTSHRIRTQRAARAGDPVALAAVAIFDDVFAEEKVEAQLAAWRSSARFASGQPTREDLPGPSELRSVSSILDDLDALVGLADVKSEIRTLLNLVQINVQRTALGLPAPRVSLHLVFAGPPGTGKTTVARLYGELLCAAGILESGSFREVARQDLVAGFVGQTATKTDAVINESLGGVLFIDEAYSLATESGDHDYGREAIEVLLKRMEDDRSRFAVVAAGYTENMRRFLGSNPGLASRFTQSISFPSYSINELITIFERHAGSHGFRLAPRAARGVNDHLTGAWSDRDANFGNARYVRQLFESAIRLQARRLVACQQADRSSLMTLEPEDIPSYA